jgi:hypothetical protein
MRQICCWDTHPQPLYECQHYDNGIKCGNLMHAACIERYGKCHDDAGVKEYERITGNS